MAMKLLATNIESGDATSDFTSDIDSTYKLYIFKFIDINPATDAAHFGFQVNATDGADYDDSPITSTYFFASHDEADSAAEIDYHATHDQAQGTAFQNLAHNVGNGADESCAGTLWLFNPSNTTYIKQFNSTFNIYNNSDYSFNTFCGGYINATTAVDDIRFKFSSGNMDGTIKMYGVG